jgi:hypothetical protein
MDYHSLDWFRLSDCGLESLLVIASYHVEPDSGE